MSSNFYNRYKKYIIISIIILSAFLRLYKLDFRSLWYDEVQTIRSAQASHVLLPDFQKSPNHRTLYITMMHYWLGLFEKSDFLTRLPSAIFGILSVFLVYLLVKKIFDEKTAFLSTLVFSLSKINIWYSQEARVYSLLVLLTLASFYVLLEALEKDRRSLWSGYIVITMLCLCAHLEAFFIILSQIIYVVLFRKRYRDSLKNFLFSQTVIAGFLFILLLPAIIGHFRVALPPWIPRPQFLSYINIFLRFAPFSINTLGPPASLSEALGFNWIYFVSLSCMGAIGCFSGSGPRYRQSACLLLIWLFIPVLLPYIISLASGVSIFGPVRYVLSSSVPFLIMASVGISGIRYFRIKMLAMIIILLISMHSLQVYYTVNQRPPWREVVSIIEENYRENDKAVFLDTNRFDIAVIMHYYENSGDAFLIREEFKEFLDRDIDYNRLWLVLEDKDESGSLEIERYLQKIYHREYTWNNNKIYVMLYDRYT